MLRGRPAGHRMLSSLWKPLETFSNDRVEVILLVIRIRGEVVLQEAGIRQPPEGPHIVTRRSALVPTPANSVRSYMWFAPISHNLSCYVHVMLCVPHQLLFYINKPDNEIWFLNLQKQLFRSNYAMKCGTFGSTFKPIEVGLEYYNWCIKTHINVLYFFQRRCSSIVVVCFKM